MAEYIILVRHLKKDAPREQAFYGSTDLGILPAEVSAVDYAGAVYSSPMKRCLETADVYFPGKEKIIVDDAKECDFGNWEGMTFQEIAECHPEEVEQWKNGADFTFPGGERIKDFSDRVEKMSQWLMQKQEKSVLLVSHAGVIRFMLCHFLGIEYKKSMAFTVEPGSFSCIKVFENGMGVAHKLNSTGEQSWLKSL